TVVPQLANYARALRPRKTTKPPSSRLTPAIVEAGSISGARSVPPPPWPQSGVMPKKLSTHSMIGPPRPQPLDVGDAEAMPDDSANMATAPISDPFLDMYSKPQQ